MSDPTQPYQSKPTVHSTLSEWQRVSFEKPNLVATATDNPTYTVYNKVRKSKGEITMVEMNSRKAAIIGCGFVGSASAFALMESHLFSEIVLIDADKNRAEGEALDISHGLPFAKPMQIYAGDCKV